MSIILSGRARVRHNLLVGEKRRGMRGKSGDCKGSVRNMGKVIQWFSQWAGFFGSKLLAQEEFGPDQIVGDGGFF
jgi:hypothetical protein